MRNFLISTTIVMTKHLLFLAVLVIACTSCRFSHTSDSATCKEPEGLELPSYDESEHVIAYSGFTVSYNHKTLIPNWVAYELTAEDLEVRYASKSSSFSMDMNLQGRQAMREDYSHSGWDKGHMAPKADMRWSEQAYWESHYFTNICPQDHGLNAGDWNSLEKKIREWAMKYGKVYVVCGPIIDEAKYGTIGRNRVAIPDKFFKAVLVNDGGSYSAVAYVMENNSKHHNLKNYIYTVDELEAMIGRNLFEALDAIGGETVEGSVKEETW